MNWEEVGSVLRWHAVNGTYPSKTISETNYDAELAGLVGSGDYSSTGGGHTSLLAPASVGDTNIKVASVSALNAAGTTGIFGVGQPVAIDEVSTENGTVASIGTAGQSTTLTAKSAVGDTNVKVASVTGVTVGHSYRVGSRRTTSTRPWRRSAPRRARQPHWPGLRPRATRTSRSPASAASRSARRPASTSTPNDEYGTVASIGTAAAAATTLAAAANAGDTNVKVTSITGMTVGHLIKVDTGANLEVRTITSVGTAGSGGTGIDLTAGSPTPTRVAPAPVISDRRHPDRSARGRARGRLGGAGGSAPASPSRRRSTKAHASGVAAGTSAPASPCRRR